MTSTLELRHVSKVYGSGPSEVNALSEVDLTFEPGELVAVMGPSGSGKSTLLTIAGSLEAPSGGQVLVDGVDLANVSPSERARMRRRAIGYVFQDFNLLPGLTAVENVTLPLELDGVRALLGAVLGVAGAYVLLVAIYHDDLGYLSSVPVLYIPLAVIGVPLAATAAGWLVAGRAPPATARSAIE